MAYQPISMRRRIETTGLSIMPLILFPYQPISMRRRIETRGLKHRYWCQRNLTNQYPWEEGLKLKCTSIGGESTLPYQPISMRRRIETQDNQGEATKHWNLTNQYPWEEGLKQRAGEVFHVSETALPTNIHEKKDWNVVSIHWWGVAIPLTNQYPWEEGLKLVGAQDGLKVASAYQPISMRRRIETAFLSDMLSRRKALTNQYPWEEGLKPPKLSSSMFRVLDLPTNIHEKKDWNQNQFLDTKLFNMLTNQYPWEEGLKLAIQQHNAQTKSTYQPISMRRRIETQVQVILQPIQ